MAGVVLGHHPALGKDGPLVQVVGEFVQVSGAGRGDAGLERIVYVMGGAGVSGAYS